MPVKKELRLLSCYVNLIKIIENCEYIYTINILSFKTKTYFIILMHKYNCIK